MPNKRAQLSRPTRPNRARGASSGARAQSRETHPVPAEDDGALACAIWLDLTERRADLRKKIQKDLSSGESSAGVPKLIFALLELSLVSVESRRGNFPSNSGAAADVYTGESHLVTMVLRLLSANDLTESGDLDLAAELLRRARTEALGVAPNASESDASARPIKIHTLGRFDVLLHDKPPEFSRKVPRKVLSLLKAIIAFGGHEVPEQRIIDALWPDHEGDAARHSLTATLHRLRSVLGDMKAIVQSGGELSLDESRCWTDANAFELLIERCNGDATELEKALALYRGVFLPQEDNCSWAAPMRERLRAKFIHAVGACGAALETNEHFDAAIDLYSRGIEADNLVEPFYQGLMRCYDRMDRRTEAVSIYRRLRETLSITLGVSPSSTSQRLFETLRLN